MSESFTQTKSCDNVLKGIPLKEGDYDSSLTPAQRYDVAAKKSPRTMATISYSRRVTPLAFVYKAPLPEPVPPSSPTYRHD